MSNMSMIVQSHMKAFRKSRLGSSGGKLEFNSTDIQATDAASLAKTSSVFQVLTSKDGHPSQ